VLITLLYPWEEIPPPAKFLPTDSDSRTLSLLTAARMKDIDVYKCNNYGATAADLANARVNPPSGWREAWNALITSIKDPDTSGELSDQCEW